MRRWLGMIAVLIGAALALGGPPRQGAQGMAPSGLPVLAVVRTPAGQTIEFDSIEQALTTAPAGSTVTITPGTYAAGAVITADNLTIKADGVHLRDTARQGKALLVIAADNTLIEGLEVSGVAVPDRNGAAFRLEGVGLTLRRVNIHDNQEGLLGGGGVVTIEDSLFRNNGFGGQAHHIYINQAQTALIIRRSDLFSAIGEGHEIKSRGRLTRIEHSRIASLDGRDSRLIDVPNGGQLLILNSILEEGPASSNREVIGFGHEGVTQPQNSIQIRHSTFIYDGSSPANVTWVAVVGSTVPSYADNAFIGGAQTRMPGADSRYRATRAEAGIAAYPFLPAVSPTAFPGIVHLPLLAR
ncbi:MAG TPA: hypothetical protein VGE07_13335 [Herpetosiphonaceae bacterium]